jgi:hypothetical protein
VSEESIPRYPLEWPLGWKRCRSRRNGQFSMTREDRRPEGTLKRSTPVNMATATERLEDQLEKLGAREPVLSTNVTLTMGGRPRGDENPSDPGAAVYFKFRGKATVLLPDREKVVNRGVRSCFPALRRLGPHPRNQQRPTTGNRGRSE